MENQNKSKLSFKELLDKLQQDSWQLELLISGFAIYGLIAGLHSIEIAHKQAVAQESLFSFFFVVAAFSCKILIVNLLIHVIIRGLWIGAIGLRYVSDDIDYKELKYSPRFTKYLEIKVGPFDNYIAKLENCCSVLFALSFVSLFYLVSFCLITFLNLYLAIEIFIESGIFNEFIGAMLLGWYCIVFYLIAFIVFLDFITHGWLKKREWTSFLYMPIYKLYSYITLSFLYRPLVYNFLDNRFGKKIMYLLLPIYIIVFFASTLQNIRSNYTNLHKESSINFANEKNYLNTIGKENYINHIAIGSKIIQEQYLQVFIPFKKETEIILETKNPNLHPKKDKRGVRSSLISKFNKNGKISIQKKDSLQKEYLKSVNQIYKLQIDSINITSNFIIATVNKQLGFETYLPLKDIPEGKHILHVKKIDFKQNKANIFKKSDSLTLKRFAAIPFWYYNDKNLTRND